MKSVLPCEFYDRPTLEVAPELLGAEIARDGVSLRIVEVEAYIPGDSANHAFRGRTARNAPMWGPPGHSYVYLCYGLHNMVNLVTEADGRPAAVLIRGCTVVEGHEEVLRRRNGKLDCIGPGKVGQALALDTSWSGCRLDGKLVVRQRTEVVPFRTAPRVGIDYADPEHRDAAWRFIAQ